jgi:hypothetical protein
MSQVVSRIIPGNWGKAGPGWLARPLENRIGRFGGGGRIHEFLWSRSEKTTSVVKPREKNPWRVVCLERDLPILEFFETL